MLQTVNDVFQVDWLEPVPDDIRGLLEDQATRLTFNEPGTVYRIGRDQGSIFGVRRGQVRVMVETNEMAPMLGHIHAPGAWFGEVEMLLRTPAYVGMEAVAGTELVRVEGRRFNALAERHGCLWQALARLASLNLWYATSVANDLALRTSRKRLAATLLRLTGWRAAAQGNPPIDVIAANQQEVADLANVARSTASKLLQEFRRAGVLRLDYGQIAVLDHEPLEHTLRT